MFDFPPDAFNVRAQRRNFRLDIVLTSDFSRRILFFSARNGRDFEEWRRVSLLQLAAPRPGLLQQVGRALPPFPPERSWAAAVSGALASLSSFCNNKSEKSH